MQMTQTHPPLVLVSHDPSVAVLSSENVRGFQVHDKDNRPVGRVDDMVVDAESGRVRFLLVGDGGILGIGRTHRLIPVDIVKGVTGEFVFLDRTRDQVSGAPTMNPLDDDAYVTQVIRYYDCQPFWSSEYRTPDWTSPE